MGINIINLKELFDKFIQKFGFNHVYKGSNFIMDIGAEVASEPEVILESLYVSSLLGGRCVLFFNNAPELKNLRLLNGIFIIVSFGIPQKVTVPAIFCKSAQDVKKALEISVEISDETRLPVMIVLAKQLVGSLMEYTDFNFGSQKTYSNLTKELFKTPSTGTIIDKLSVAEALLHIKLSQPKISGLLSLNEYGSFFNYLVPLSNVQNTIDLENTFINSWELGELKGILEQYSLSIPVKKSDEKVFENDYFRKNLCPGCPFVSIFKNINFDSYEVFTDIDCSSVLEQFSMTKLSSNEAYGIFISNVNKKYLFIGRYSRFREKFVDKIPKDSVILLKDMSRKTDFLKVISHPEKAGLPNYVFPYACENIIRYGSVKFNSAKCSCFKKGIEPLCIKNTFCPALELNGNKIFLNSNLCTGCNACIKFCPAGALK